MIEKKVNLGKKAGTVAGRIYQTLLTADQKKRLKRLEMPVPRKDCGGQPRRTHVPRLDHSQIMPIVNRITHRVDGFFLKWVQQERPRGRIKPWVEGVAKGVNVEEDVPVAHLPQFSLRLGVALRFRQDVPTKR